MSATTVYRQLPEYGYGPQPVYPVTTSDVPAWVDRARLVAVIDPENPDDVARLDAALQRHGDVRDALLEVAGCPTHRRDRPLAEDGASGYQGRHVAVVAR